MLCPIDNCDKSVPSDKVMCGRHWKTVPRELQRAVYRTWNARLKRRDVCAIDEHEKAKTAAIDVATAAERERTSVTR